MADAAELKPTAGRALSMQAAVRLEHALARGREKRQLRCRPDRPLQCSAAALRAAALEDAVRARAAEGAFERTNHRVARIRRQVDVAAFAARLEQQHQWLPILGRRLRCEPIAK